MVDYGNVPVLIRFVENSITFISGCQGFYLGNTAKHKDMPPAFQKYMTDLTIHLHLIYTIAGLL